MRADRLVSERLGISRNQASELIALGGVLADKAIIAKSSQILRDDAHIEQLGDVYVGRAALKLKTYLASSGFSVAGLSVLDVGCSTGGFMQVLLSSGVASVLGVDVGQGQISPLILQDTRARVFEQTDIRGFKSDDKFDLITCDVSFISLKLILEALCKNAKVGASIILLFKPQFEVGKEARRSKKGVVLDKKAILSAQKSFELEAARLNLVLADTRECGILGKEGNVEYFYRFVRA
ncbi:TlyA family RNA methyltransferase [Campylobacter sp. 19-13652]|uniref:23S rRNA (cytidine-2'-O)-methyltransferase TlyA n=1 Tax=Campylobacter sp. 19-13652 TaxID=2840180 RepID=UPI001C74CFD9|nr:SAM-dependent methyltransferase [Campylobacter sp. 19-13652]BCX79659.1 hemolysin [Campylobacter sp. 19-13652]